MGDDDRKELKPSIPIQPTTSESPSPLNWDLGATLLLTAIAHGGSPAEVATAKVAAGWVQEYHHPDIVEPPLQKEKPVLSTRELQVAEVTKALALATQSLAVFASQNQEFMLVGGDAFPMNTLIQSGLTPEQIVQDRGALHMLAHFIIKSGQCFDGVSEKMFATHGTSKTTVVEDFKQSYANLAGTWEIPEFGATEEFRRRITSSRR